MKWTWFLNGHSLLDSGFFCKTGWTWSSSVISNNVKATRVVRSNSYRYCLGLKVLGNSFTPTHTTIVVFERPLYRIVISKTVVRILQHLYLVSLDTLNQFSDLTLCCCANSPDIRCRFSSALVFLTLTGSERNARNHGRRRKVVSHSHKYWLLHKKLYGTESFISFRYLDLKGSGVSCPPLFHTIYNL